ncbi:MULTISPECIES: hypothetical protein [unclassified Exiguobacterium]|uniref:hypothetical protein n=1 Tax=unclassified Exiguobacterium TaxID=2644629 RepID=UPI001BECC942|nr:MULTISPECIES: hypothetical protein [unclassified Exiguobacterium]
MFNYILSNDTKTAKVMALFSGMFALAIGLYTSFEDILNSTIPVGTLLIAIGIMQICNYLLIPHISVKDERSKLIKEKAMTANYYVFLTLLFSILLVVTLPSSDPIFTLKEIMIMLVSIYLVSTHILMLYYSKKI